MVAEIEQSLLVSAIAQDLLVPGTGIEPVRPLFRIAADFKSAFNCCKIMNLNVHHSRITFRICIFLPISKLLFYVGCGNG
jgi:hypothetical protein